MATVPTEWWDSRGNSYRVLGGTYFDHATGSGVGFDLGPHRGKTRPPIVLTGDTPIPFADVQVVEPRVWRRWPELARELARWRKSEIKRCTETAICETNPNGAFPAYLQGVAWEYRLDDGRTLQFLSATSHRPTADGILQHYALVKLWRVVGAGEAHVLRDDKGWLSGITTESDGCANQCDWKWRARPEVLSLSGRTFVFGAYSGGTVAGYQFVEVLPQKLRLLGWYRWGS